MTQIRNRLLVATLAAATAALGALPPSNADAQCFSETYTPSSVITDSDYTDDVLCNIADGDACGNGTCTKEWETLYLGTCHCEVGGDPISWTGHQTGKEEECFAWNAVPFHLLCAPRYDPCPYYDYAYCTRIGCDDSTDCPQMEACGMYGTCGDWNACNSHDNCVEGKACAFSECTAVELLHECLNDGGCSPPSGGGSATCETNARGFRECVNDCPEGSFLYTETMCVAYPVDECRWSSDCTAPEGGSVSCRTRGAVLKERYCHNTCPSGTYYYEDGHRCSPPPSFRWPPFVIYWPLP